MLRMPWGAGAFALALSVPLASPALQVSSETVTLGWSPAPGPVDRYGVWLRRDTGGYPAEPDFYTGAAQITLRGDPGSQLRVRVAAFDSRGRQGPMSPQSEAIVFASTPPPPPPPPSPAGPARPWDLDGDDRTDVMWRNAANVHLLQLMTERGSKAGEIFHLPELLQVEGSADFDGDGYADLLMREEWTGYTEIWFMIGTSVRQRGFVVQDSSSLVGAVGDFDGDGYADILWREGRDGRIDFMRGEHRIATRTLSGAFVFSNGASADLDGDGFAELIVYGGPERDVEVWLLRNRPIALGSAPRDARLVGSGDVDGDRRDDLIWQVPGSGVFTVWFMDGWQVRTATSATGGAADLAVALGDFDGDGRANEILAQNVLSGENNLLTLDDWNGASWVGVSRRSITPLNPELWVTGR